MHCNIIVTFFSSMFYTNFPPNLQDESTSLGHFPNVLFTSQVTFLYSKEKHIEIMTLSSEPW